MLEGDEGVLETIGDTELVADLLEPLIALTGSAVVIITFLMAAALRGVAVGTAVYVPAQRVARARDGMT